MANITPITIAAGTTTYAAVHIDGRLCRSVPRGVMPSVIVTCVPGSVVVGEGATYSPLSVVVTLSYPCGPCGCVRTVQFSDTVLAGVTGTATAITATASNVTYSLDSCRHMGVNALLTITSVAAAS